MDTLDPGAGRAADEKAGRDPPGQARLRQLAEEQAALRRVATMVARSTPPEEVFAAVVQEVGQLLRVELATLARYEPGPTAAPVTVWGPAGTNLSVGFQFPLEGHNVSTLVFETGRPARVDGYVDGSSGPFTAFPREGGIRSAVGTPVIVEGRLWGVIFAGSTREQPLPPDTETRLASFTELVATAIANTDGRAALARLAREQAALRRVATLVAQGTAPQEVLAAVAEETGRLLEVDYTVLIRSDPQDMITVVGGWTASGGALPSPVGSRFEVGGRNVSTLTLRTGRAARLDAYAGVTGSIGETGAHGWGFRSSLGVPISVEGRPWGLILVAYTRDQLLPADTEARLASFTELVATAIANADSRASVARLAREQAALRRVATLVARGAAPEEVFAVVAEGVGQLLPVDSAILCRYEPEGALTFVSQWGIGAASFPVGSRWMLGGHNVGTLVFQTGRPARVDDLAESSSGPLAAGIRQAGLHAAIGTPVIVEGRLWGLISIGSHQEQPLPPDTEARLVSFTELVATAIANADSRAALAASRARIVAAADETRRRIQRDLHDGTQQQLVTLLLDLQGVQAAVPPQVGELEDGVARIVGRVTGVIDRVREISRGIHPAILSELGLRAALKMLARQSAVPVQLDLRTGPRLPQPVEVAAYYAVSEALANAAKHARASTVHVELDTPDNGVRLAIRDDGVGGADPARGSGLTGLRDRIEAVGGTLEVTSPAGGGTTLLIEIPG